MKQHESAKLGRFDPVKRAAEKRASREQDQRDLVEGRKSQAQLRGERGAFAFPRARIRFDKAKSLA